MKLNHLNLCVSDVAEARDFYVKLFGFKCLGTTGKDAVAVLEDDSGFVMVPNKNKREDAVAYPPHTHIGFFVENVGEVEMMYEHLRAEGVHLRSEIANIPRGITFYCQGPGAMPIEVAWLGIRDYREASLRSHCFYSLAQVRP